jgi:hypothetical protein
MSFAQPSWQGPIVEFDRLDVYPWITEILHRPDIFCSFSATWWTPNLPDGYDYYLVTYHVENIDVGWLKRQKVNGKIIVVFPGREYDLKIPGITFVGYTELHNDLNKMIEWHGIQDLPNTKQYKFSTVCNRVSQGKIWTTTQVLESEPNSLVILNPDWIEDKNVHNWELTGFEFLDNLTNTFREKYINLKLSDGFDNSKDNNQRTNSNPWQPLYTDVALHIVAGSFHYSWMGDYTYPGPDIDEKTLKCLLAGVPFLPGMQFEVYDYLSSFGLRFDYDFDTSFDSDPGNLTRFQKLCILIDELSNWSIDDIVAATKSATEHNKQHIVSGEFAKQCKDYNQLQVEKIYDELSTRS